MPKNALTSITFSLAHVRGQITLHSLHQQFLRQARFIINCFALLCMVCCTTGTLEAQAPGNESMQSRVKRATDLIHAKQLVKARPLLVQLRPEVDPAMHANLDFYIALSYVFEYYEKNNSSALDTGLEKFQGFVKSYLKDSLVPLARYNIADIHAIKKDFKKALQGYIPLYKNPEPGIDRKDILKKIVLIYVSEEQWEAGMPYFEASMRIAEDSTDRATSAAYLLIAQAKQGIVTDSRQLLQFFTSPAPVFYTPRFNAALMEVGDQLKTEGDLPTASLFYQFVRSYESLELGLTNHIANLKERVAKFEGNVVLRNFYIDAKTELDNATADLAAVKATKNYTPLLHWRIAGVYLDMERDWEAFWRFRKMVDKYPDHEYAESILFSAFSLGHKLDQYDIAEELSKRYLSNPNFRTYRATVADSMSSMYLEYEKYEELYAMTREYLSHSAGDAASALLLFKHGMARLRRFENPELINDFQTFNTKYGETNSAVVIRYFLGLGLLIEEDHQGALDNFELVLAEGDTRYKPDASFRKALAVMGLDRIPEARDLVVEFIENYPDNPLRAQAELILGNLVDLLGDANKALGHYYLVEQYSDDLELNASAELKISRILVDQNEIDTAIGRLRSFIDTHVEDAATIPIVAALADIYKDLEKPRVALETIKEPIIRFFTLTEIDKLDTLLLNYITKDRAVREMEVATEAFFQEITDSPDLFRDLVIDRAKQYRYFKEHSSVDGLVRDYFLENEDFRNAVKAYFKEVDQIQAANETAKEEAANSQPPTQPKLLEPMHPVGELAVLIDLRKQVAELNASMPKQTADDWLKSQLAEARAANNIPLELRIQTALAKAEDPESAPNHRMVQLFDDPEQWSELGLAPKLWILRKVAELDPARVIEELEISRVDYMNTDFELERHLLRAKAYKQAEQPESAIEAYQVLIKRFAQANESGEAMIAIGRMQIELGNYQAARDQLETILHRNDWRGQMHGDALLWIGRAYVAEEKYPEAHGFFERIMLGYPGFPELLAQGYYEDIQVLKKMGDTASVQTVYEAFKLTPGLEDTEAAKLIRKEFE